MSKKLATITRKTLLYKSGAVDSYALNYVEGCTHGCRYPCYAMMMKKSYGKIKSYEDWTRPKIVENALELLDKELPRLKRKGGLEQVYMCFSTDPFMYQVKEVQELTLEILRRLKQADVKAVLITKGVYPEELADTSRYHAQNEYGVSLVSLSEVFRKKYEPGSAPYKLRIEALKRLHNAGLKTWVIMEPYPTPNIIEQDIHEILEAISFVDEVVFGKWNYSRLVSAYPNYKEFYKEMAHEVDEFCRSHSIGVRVKEGTT